MSKTIFNTKQMDLLEQNPKVDKVSDRSITYNSPFKIRAAKEHLEGKSSQQIFINNGFDLQVIGSKKPNQWLKQFECYWKMSKMRKDGLVAKVREANPYKKMAQATQEHKTCDNLVNRELDQVEPDKVLLTNITYIDEVDIKSDPSMNMG